VELTEQQQRFFETFGYLHLPGVLAERIGWITEQYEAVWRERGVVHDGTQRSCIVPFIDQLTEFCTLLDDARIVGLVRGLLGEDFNYLGGDGNWYTGDTQWHPDGAHSVGKWLKVAFYLDPVGRDTGCLRVIPGTHRLDAIGAWEAREARRSEELWGVSQRDVPSIALETQPGDLVAFNHNLMHASFGGSTHRRMFTMNFVSHCVTAEEKAELRAFINAQARFWIEHLHSDAMRETGPAERRRYLRQVWEHEDELSALSAKYRETAAEPSRG
jgi:ectoine hydroxylase-related dioxygenase (phytanoyl-CoA dioxygenase family)